MINPKQVITPEVEAVAALLADPSRALMLQALCDARARPASELARFAGVSPQTASAHLSRLLAGRSDRDLRFARTCYKHLAGRVGVAITEALCAIPVCGTFRTAEPALPGLERASLSPWGTSWRCVGDPAVGVAMARPAP